MPFFCADRHLQYKGRLFKVAMLDRWLVLVTGPQLIEELRVLPESDMSLHEALCQVCALLLNLVASFDV
jgi:hypothetical protein